MVDKLNTFEGIGNGVAITTANSGGTSGDAFNAVSGTVTAQTTGAISGSVSAKAALSTSTESYVAWNVSGSSHWVRMYFTTDAASTTHNKRMIWSGIAGSGTLGFDLRQIVSSERIGLALRNVTQFELGPSGSGTGTLARNTTYRVEAKWTTTTVDAWLYNSAGTLLDSNSATVAVDATTQIKFGCGNGSNTTSNLVYDAIGYSPTAKLGAYVAPVPPVTVLTQADAVLVDARTSTAGNGGARSYSITQTSGATSTPAVLAAGYWAVTPSSSEDLIYNVTVTEGALSDTDPITIAQTGGGSRGIKIRTSGVWH